MMYNVVSAIVLRSSDPKRPSTMTTLCFGQYFGPTCISEGFFKYSCTLQSQYGAVGSTMTSGYDERLLTGSTFSLFGLDDADKYALPQREQRRTWRPTLLSSPTLHHGQAHARFVFVWNLGSSHEITADWRARARNRRHSTLLIVHSCTLFQNPFEDTYNWRAHKV